MTTTAEISDKTAAGTMNGRTTVDVIKTCFLDHLKCTLARDIHSATDHDRYFALAMTVRDLLINQWMHTSQTYDKCNTKCVYYFSMEYLIGRALANNVINLGIEEPVKEALKELGLDWAFLRDVERDAGLGNGGLGRLAACFLDSMATLELPGYGYGIRYDYGIFRQEIRNGYQVEEPDNWLRNGYPWEIERPEYQIEVRFGGRVQIEHDDQGRPFHRWVDYETVVGIPYDYPVAGYGNNTVNNLRLWTAKANEEFDLRFFNNGEYVRAYEQKLASENITKVLYPNDTIEQGKELRFKQQYFFVATSLHDIIRRFKMTNSDFSTFPDRVAIQLNDTHPAIAIPELMRILMDEEHLDWGAAWDITQKTFGYTNHTLMPEALETWSVRLFGALLPRHLEIVYEINRRFLRTVMNAFPADHDRVRRMSLIEEAHDKQVRMAYLSVVASHSVNGVAHLHSELIKRHLFKDFYDLWPERFNNKTNGITQRRWLLKCNPGLAQLITMSIGDGWAKDLLQLKRLESHADNFDFRRQLMEVKRENKVRLAELIQRENGITVDTDSLFDVQIKRLHEYKRQVLNIMHIIYRYNQLKENPQLDLVPRTFIFSAKAAPGYAMAKLVIKLINDLSAVINDDPDVNQKLKVVFLKDYRVSLAERIIPASDLSEQISTAGTEASGTGNMKFALNGALTIGTLDGANVEIRAQVGADNFFLFGHTVEEIEALAESGTYDPWTYYKDNPDIRRIMDMFNSDFFNLEEATLYKPLWDALLTNGDRYFHHADFVSYVAAQDQVDEAYRDTNRWARMCVMNIANSGMFSSDRTIQQYAKDIWNVSPCPVDMSSEQHTS